MYANVWAWAAEFRKTTKNMGLDKWQIPTELKQLLDDIWCWYENNTYPHLIPNISKTVKINSVLSVGF